MTEDQGKGKARKLAKTDHASWTLQGVSERDVETYSQTLYVGSLTELVTISYITSTPDPNTQQQANVFITGMSGGRPLNQPIQPGQQITVSGTSVVVQFTARGYMVASGTFSVG